MTNVMTGEEEEYYVKALRLIRKNEETEAIAVLAACPSLIQKRGGSKLLREAACSDCASVCQHILSSAELDVNEVSEGHSLLASAVGNGSLEAARVLLKHGADPNLGRALIDAINCRADTSLDLVKLLIASGSKVNRVFAMFGDRKNCRTALDFAAAKPEVLKTLKSAGAMTSKELLRNDPAIAIEG